METKETPMKFLSDRASWLDKERRSGGDYEHLTARLEECQYIAERLHPALDNQKLIGELVAALSEATGELEDMNNVGLKDFIGGPPEWFKEKHSRLYDVLAKAKATAQPINE